MKTIFTNSYFNKTFKKLLAFCVVLLMSIHTFAQVTATEDFENETTAIEATPHTFSESGINFLTTLKYQKNTGNFGFGASTSYISIRNATAGVGQTETITISNASTSFKLNSFAAYVGSNPSGSVATNGTITFVGTLVGGGTTAPVAINVASTGAVPAGQSREANGTVNGLSFAGTALDGVQITSLRVQSSATVQWIQLDHINFTTQAVVSNQYSINSVSQSEGNSGTSNMTFTITRTNNTAAGSVQVQSANGTATSGSDYTAFPLTTVNFTAGGALTQTVNVSTNGDVAVEPDETFTMTISNPTGGILLGATGTGTIIDDDAIGEPFDDEVNNTTTFSQSGNNFQTTGKLRVFRNGGNFGAGGTQGYAAPAQPYAIGNQGSLQITSPGKSFNVISVDLYAAAVSGTAPNFVFTPPASTTIAITGTKADGTGTVGPFNANITPTGTNGHTTVIIGSPIAGVQLSALSFSTPTGIQYLQIDNFDYGTATISNTQLSVNDVTVLERSGSGIASAVFTVTRTNNTTAFTVNVASSDVTAIAGTDYTAINTTLNFAIGGALTQTVTVPIISDASAEPNKTFNMTLSGATNGTLYLKQIGIGTILNDDGTIGETYEDEVNDATTFSQNTFAFSSSGGSASGGYKVKGSIGNSNGSGSSGFYLSSSANVVGSMGRITMTTPNTAFKLISLDAWVGTTISSFSSGPVTFTGTLLGGGPVSTTRTITATANNGTGWQQNVTFTGTPLNNATLTALEISTTGGSLKAVDIDNFNYTIVDTSPFISVVDASNVAITNGGAAGTANNTDFGLRCLTGQTQSKTYTIKNTGLTNLTLSGSPLAVLGGADASEFSITTQPTSPIIPGGSTTFMVLFDPNTGGAKNATITLTSSDIGNSPYVINIKGIGGSEPTATIGTIQDICAGATSFTIPFSGETANPTAYSVSGTGITTVINRTPPNSPMVVTLSNPAVFGTNPSFTFSLINGNGCISPNYTGSVTVLAGPSTTIGSNSPICSGNALNLTSSGGGTYSWTGPSFTSTAQNPSIANATTGAAGTYIVTVTNNGCTATNSVVVTVNTNPTASPSSNTPVCLGSTLNLFSSVANSYLWTGPNGFSGTTQNPSISNVSVLASAPYTLRVTNANGCTATATTVVVFNITQAPTEPTATPSSRTTAGSSTLSVTLGCAVGGTLTWFNAATNVAVPSPNNQPSFTSSGTFNFYAKCTGANTCVSDASANVPVTVTLCTPLASSPGPVDITWTGAVSTDWNTACNWSPAWVPDVTNGNVIIGNATNKPIITTGNVATVKAIKINSNGTLTVNSGGTLNIRGNGVEDNGIEINDNAFMTNNGTVKIESATQTAILASIYLRGAGNGAYLFNNGTIVINSTDTGIGVGSSPGSYVTNNLNGIITIENGTGIGVSLASDILEFSNSGIINYNGAGLAMSLQGNSTFSGSGTFKINSGTGISNTSPAIIETNPCGKILMASGTFVNTGTTTNNGLLQMPNAYDFTTNTGTFTNNGVLKANTVASVTNNELVITNTCPTFLFGANERYSVSGIFTNNTATTSAGTYDGINNKFFANNSLPAGTQTLYAQVTNVPSEGFCTFVVPFDFNNRKPTAVSVSSTSVCTGGSVTLSATCASGTTPTWYTTATGGTNIALGASVIQSPTVATTYYVACETINCASGRVATNEVTINTTLPTATATPSTQTICSGGVITTIAITGTGTSYTWVRDNTTSATGITASGSGDISGNLTNTTEAPITVTFMITPIGTCNGTPITASVVVNPIPTVTASTPSQSICSGTNITGITFNIPPPVASLLPDPSSDNIPVAPKTAKGIVLSGFVAGTVFNWTRDNTATVTGSIPASGSGNISGFLTNTTASPVTVTFTITPSYTNAGKTCDGTPITVTVIVNPNPASATITDAGTAFCSGSSTTLSAPADPNYTYAWERSLTGIASPNEFTAFGGTAQTQVITTSGVYRAIVTNQYNCSARDTTAVKFGNLVFSGSLATGDAQQTGRMNRFAVVSTCAVPKSYPGDFTTSGARFYDTYTVTNPTNAPVCATIGLTSGCGTTLFSATYLGSYNPASLSTNYLADHGSSFPGTAFYEATIPANGTIVVVVHEVNPATGCSGYDLRIDVPGTTVAPTASSNTPICAGNTLNLTGTGTGSYAWTGPNGFTSSAQNPSIPNATTLATGTYTISVTNTNNCVFNATTAVTVNATPTATASSNSPICAGNTVLLTGGGVGTSYAWVASNGYTSTAQSPTISNATISTSGTYTITVTNISGCTSTALVVVTVNATPTATASSSTPTICAGNSISLTGGGIGTYSWTSSNGFTSTAQSPTISNATVSASGTYTITVTNISGCTSTASVAVAVNALPTATASSNSPICAGTTLNLTGGGVGTYAWTSSNGFTSTDQNPNIPNAMDSMSGTYTITVTNTNGCTSTATTSVTVNPVTATPTPQANTQIIFGASITLTATGCSGVNDVLKWYKSSDNSLATMPVSPTVTTNFYAKCETTLNAITCISGNSTDVIVTVLTPTPPVATGATNCLGTPTILTATGCSGSVGTFVLKWYQNADNVLVTMPVSPTTTTDYYAKCEQTFNSVTAISGKSNVVTLTILNPPTPVSTGGTIYAGQSITLTATGCTGVGLTIKWYQTADNLLVTMPVSPTVTTQYYAKCEQTTNSVTCLSAKSNDVNVTVVNRIFVDITKINAPIQNGNSWATAYGNLQTGLAAATAGVEVWVAKGTYKPTNTITRTIYFNIPSSVKVYGGFAGTEDNLIERDFRLNTSILNGDIGTQKLAADNSYHVVVMNGSSASTVLDGFTISDGYANFDPSRTYLTSNSLAPTTGTIETGGGILIQNAGMPTIANCTIIQNSAVTGGGLYAGDASTPTILGCKFMANQAGFGSGMYFQDGSNGKIDNTLIGGNKGIGAIYNNKSDPTITNTTFGGNGGYNGGIFNSNSQPVVKNSIIWGNSTPFNDTQSIITYSTIQGGYVGVGNLSIDPKFVSLTPEGLSPSISGDYHVQASSLTIDRADNGSIRLTDQDLDGNLRRFAGGKVDMGAYEFQDAATANLIISAQTGDWENNSTWVGFKVPQLGDYVIIDNNHVVTLKGTGIAKNLEYRGTGQLKFNATTSKLEIGF